MGLRCWAALALALGFASSASAQDLHARWRAESDTAVMTWVANETRAPGEERLSGRVRREEDGAATVVERGVQLEGENATAAYERRYRAMDYEVSPMENATPSAAFLRCQTRLTRCPDSPRRCTAEVRRCLFGEPTLSRGAGAELVLPHPVTPQERRSSQREAVLRWQEQTLRVRIPLNNPIDGVTASYGGPPTLEVERLSPRREVLVMTVQQPGDEDPPRSRQYFLIRDGALAEIVDPTIARFAYDSRLPGNGTIVVDENPWSTCERLDFAPRVRRSRVIVRVSDDGRVHSARRVPRRGHWDCRELPACPFVDRLDGDRPRRLGEILRHVRHTPETQELAVGLADALVVLSISEEKPEVTHLDAVWLRVGDAVIPPDACRAEAPVHCLRDGRSTRLEQGDTLELEFRVPPSLRGREAFLVAHGMYVPLE